MSEEMRNGDIIPEDQNLKEEQEKLESTILDSVDNYANIEFDDEELEESSSLYGQQYDLPESKDGYIDTGTGEVIDRENLTPWEVIRAIAAQTNTKIREPRKGCRHCYGRGYDGIDVKTRSPIPCNCIYPDKTAAEKMADSMYDGNRINGHVNRAHRRFIQQGFKRQLRQYKRMIKRREARGFYNPPAGTETSATDMVEQEG